MLDLASSEVVSGVRSGEERAATILRLRAFRVARAGFCDDCVGYSFHLELLFVAFSCYNLDLLTPPTCPPCPRPAPGACPAPRLPWQVDGARMLPALGASMLPALGAHAACTPRSARACIPHARARRACTPHARARRACTPHARAWRACTRTAPDTHTAAHDQSLRGSRQATAPERTGDAIPWRCVGARSMAFAALSRTRRTAAPARTTMLGRAGVCNPKRTQPRTLVGLTLSRGVSLRSGVGST